MSEAESKILLESDEKLILDTREDDINITQKYVITDKRIYIIRLKNNTYTTTYVDLNKIQHIKFEKEKIEIKRSPILFIFCIIVAAVSIFCVFLNIMALFGLALAIVCLVRYFAKTKPMYDKKLVIKTETVSFCINVNCFRDEKINDIIRKIYAAKEVYNKP